MKLRRLSAVLLQLFVVGCLAAVGIAQRGAPPAMRPGSMGAGETLLPNGWRIQPAGRHMAIGDLPLNMVLSPDGQSLIVANGGYDKPTLRVVDLQRGEVSSVVSLDDAWYGLAWSPDGTKLYSSGAASNSILELGWKNHKLTPTSRILLGRSAEAPAPGLRKPEATDSFVGGVAVSPDGGSLAAVHILGNLISVVDMKSGAVRLSTSLAAEPYTAIYSRDGSTLFVSLWGGARVLALDPWTLAIKADIPVGEHPNAMVQSGDRLFVACANTNAIWVIDPAAFKATEQISIALFPEAPPGSTPNALAVSADGRRLAVANADNNTAALVDISAVGQSRVLGFIPTGWYPTGILFNRTGDTLFVLSGKGLTSMPNPRGNNPGVPGAPGQYTGSMLQGSLSIVPVPTDDTLRTYTNTVYRLTPYSDATRLAPSAAPSDSPVPARVGGSSPITHVFYIIRENRTYDQILGDLDRGNGDPNLTLFGENVTPNAHALAREFVTLDNFYVDAEVSYDGHAFSTGAYANDFVEKIWPMNYANRGAAYLSEGGGAMRTAYGNITAPANGYIWDAMNRAGKSVRSYGEFAARDAATGKMKATVPGLEGRVHPDYPTFDLKIPDGKRVDIWLKEFQQFEADGTLPALSIIRLPDDHTSGTSVGYPTPTAMIAENDQALGRVVDAISHSRDWAQSAIFVLEDDAQNGPDHVDAHRSVALVISPYTLRGAVDSTLYTTSSMLRTMELILGLPPMSQYDAAARPMYNSFTSRATATAFTERPATVKLDDMNLSDAPGAAASAAMNFSIEDAAPEQPLNEIVWQSVRGRGAVMPPPVHAAFIKPTIWASGKDDDDDAPAATKLKAKG